METLNWELGHLNVVQFRQVKACNSQDDIWDRIKGNIKLIENYETP